MIFKKILIFQLYLLPFFLVPLSAEFKESDRIMIKDAGESMESSPVSRKPLPIYVSQLSNLNDYSLFANGGWDANWYVGFNVCWMEMMPQPPAGQYKRVYIGAKIGRMKSRPAKGKPAWEKEPIPGSIYIAISSIPAWKTTQQYFLVSSDDIPLEGDTENALEGAGESRWFWVEVPAANVNMDGPNYIALWSPTEYFVSVASAPILAGGWGGKKVNSWISNDVKGYPPIKASEALKNGISVFEPAIAMKLVPEGTEQSITVLIASIIDGREGTANKTLTADVSGDEISRVWLEVSSDGKPWGKHGGNVYSAPYMFTLRADKVPEGEISVRIAAMDIWGNTGYSAPVDIFISKTQK
jgi:hypothetical protein